jgi:carbon monoxide dehydrogenase subunit G
MNTFSIDIAAPPARVFHWIHDAERNKQWLPNLVESEVLEQRPGEVGSRFRQMYVENGRRMEMFGTVTGYEQDRYLACEITGPFTLFVDYRLEATGSGTRVTQNSQVRMNGFLMKLIGALMKPMMNKMAAKNAGDSFGKLKRLAEADRS